MFKTNHKQSAPINGILNRISKICQVMLAESPVALGWVVLLLATNAGGRILWYGIRGLPHMPGKRVRGVPVLWASLSGLSIQQAGKEEADCLALRRNVMQLVALGFASGTRSAINTELKDYPAARAFMEGSYKPIGWAGQLSFMRWR